MIRGGGSLLRASLNASPDARQVRLDGISYFAVPDPVPRTLRKHDLVTIIVREQSEFKSKGALDIEKEAELRALIEQFFQFNVGGALLSNAIGAEKPEISLRGNRAFKGDGQLDRQDSFTARITAEVVDVKPNNTLVLQARKRIVTDEDEQLFVLTGICRAEDITADNTVLSTQLYDLELAKTTNGPIRNATKRGFLPRLLDGLNPW
jgi:flagellar L-ring protein precursor FlgH